MTLTGVLPELKRGDVLRNPETGHMARVWKVGKGDEYDEPVYYLEYRSGARSKHPTTGEKLGADGYELKEQEA